MLTALGVTLFWRYQVMDHFAGQNYAAHLTVLDAIPGTLFTFCAGFGLAYLLVERRPVSPARRPLLLVIPSTALVALAQWLQANLTTYWTGHWMLGVFNPLMAAVIAALILALLRPVAALPMALLITAVLAGLSHRYLEAPLMQLGRRGS